MDWLSALLGSQLSHCRDHRVPSIDNQLVDILRCEVLRLDWLEHCGKVSINSNLEE